MSNGFCGSDVAVEEAPCRDSHGFRGGRFREYILGRNLFRCKSLRRDVDVGRGHLDRFNITGETS